MPIDMSDVCTNVISNAENHLEGNRKRAGHQIEDVMLSPCRSFATN